MRAGRVDTLLALGGNPIYDAPADLEWADAAAIVRDTIHAGLYENETAQASRWFLPLTHELESWGDGRAYDGTLSLAQPLIRPLHDGRSLVELLAALAGDLQPDGHALVKDSLGKGVERDWEAALAAGFVDGTAEPAAAVTVDPHGVEQALGALRAPLASAGAIEIGFYLSPTVHDGRFANNAWLQELPSPVGKLTWDNAALMSPATAGALGAGEGELVQVEAGGRSVRVPVLIVPGHADGSLSLWLGYGRRGHERVAAGVGTSAFPLRSQAAPWFVAGAAHKVAGHHALAITQAHWAMVDRKGDDSFALRTTRAELARVAEVTAEHRGEQPSFFTGPGRTAGMVPPAPGPGP